MTMKEFNTVVGAVIKRDQKMLAWQCWTTVALDRTKKLPPLPVFLGERMEASALSAKIIKSMSLRNEKAKLLESTGALARSNVRNTRRRAKPDNRASKSSKG
jgi:hypothetical protein